MSKTDLMKDKTQVENLAMQTAKEDFEMGLIRAKYNNNVELYSKEIGPKIAQENEISSSLHQFLIRCLTQYATDYIVESQEDLSGFEAL